MARMTAEHIVHCHRCPGRTAAEVGAGVPNPAEHRRGDSSLSRLPGWSGPGTGGGLWHCPKHRGPCPQCGMVPAA